MARSPKGQKILQFIQNYTAGQGYPPSVRDIQRGLGISSTSVVAYHLDLLEREGLIQRSREISRGIRLRSAQGDRGLPMVEVPLLGRITAGEPAPVPDGETALDTLSVPSYLLKGEKRIYALEVRGNSMIDALIDEGDIVLLQHISQVDNGDMAAVWIKSRKETTLKRVYRQGRKVRLQPANPLMDAILIDADDVEIQGKVIAVMRRVR